MANQVTWSVIRDNQPSNPQPLELPDGLNAFQIVRAIKREAGLSKVRGCVRQLSNALHFRPFDQSFTLSIEL